jgi:hypothetical protein
MTKHKIIYVDEEKTEIRNFQRKFSSDFEVMGCLPAKQLSELIETILDSEVTALVTDFNLSEYRVDVKYPVPYDGVNVVEALLEIREGFPCFILTSFDGDAIKESEDVNLIYPKDALNHQVGKTTLQEKVHVQIEHYRARLKNASLEFDALMAKASTAKLTEREECRLQELDSFLEKSLNAKSSIPSSAKHGTSLKRLGELLRSTDELLKELRKGGKK